mgnify:CR=1 FL=1
MFLVADAVVVDVPQERGRHVALVAHEEDSPCPARGSTSLSSVWKFGERHRALLQFLAQERPAVAPGDEHREHGPRQRERDPAAARDLGRVAEDEREIDQAEQAEHEPDAPQRPLPRGARRDRAEQRRDHHGAVHGGAVGAGQSARALEDQHERAGREEHERVRRGHVDLPMRVCGGLQDFHARQEVELHGLARDRERAGDRRLRGDDGSRGREDDQERQSGGCRRARRTG